MTLAIVLLSAALAAPQTGGWRLDSGAPPAPLGGDLYRFAAGIDLEVLPAVVLAVEPGAAPPPGAIPLGGRSWLLPTPDAASAIDAALQLQARAGVRAAWPDVVLPIAPAGAAFDDPGYGGQWYLEELGMEALFDVSLGDPGVRIAVIDSGIDVAHADLAAAVADPYDAWQDDDDPSPDPGEYCSGGGSEICDEHGTAVSGVIVARANNGAGVVGLCPECTLIPIKLLGEGSGNTLSADVAAFEHAIAADAAVINNSWGFTTAIPVPEPLADVIRRAATEPRGGKGALVVFAAGNDDRVIEESELQALPDVLCVSATDSYGQPTAYTNTGASVDLAAPSATVTIAPGDEVITNFGGTSAAAPVVSGLAAWALAVDPEMTAAELADLLIETAVPSPLVTVDEAGHHDTYGYGELSAAGVLEALTGGPEETGAGAAGEPGGCGCGGGSGAAGLLGALAAIGAAAGRRRPI